MWDLHDLDDLEVVSLVCVADLNWSKALLSQSHNWDRDLRSRLLRRLPLLVLEEDAGGILVRFDYVG